MSRNIDLNNTSTHNLASTTMSRCPDAFHWNCGRLGTCANELNLLFGHIGHPALLLLQGTRSTQQAIRGYDGYLQHAIAHTAIHDSSERLVQAQAAVFVPEGSSNIHKCTQKSKFRMATESSCATSACVLLVCGDFNAPHRDWGYGQDFVRLKRFSGETEAVGLVLANDTAYSTRHGLHAGQQDTSPNLTWSTPCLVREWRCGLDTMGSDHYPIWLEHNIPTAKRHTCHTKAVNCDEFRANFKALRNEHAIPVKIVRTAEDSTRHISVNGNQPTPDQHLLNLWNTRQQLHPAYLASGRRYVDLRKVSDKTTQARRYAK
ncbi:hypothetical protein HPB48_020114 [Haemaphysalis longicornis]|uniref:Endonuclease/exonuclease/phosphatase domain-containing protein n=1 Tax=Haemaphysalis longicornis TaxID=44386 RepID=A0A9J6FL13_HAELO|nr:hypothetical protein HPB48_020114 [Haemaphysalis longicornis]